MKNVICLQASKILEMTGRMLTGRYMSFEPLNPFLKTGAIFASFKIEGKSPLSTESLKKSEI